MKKILCFGDSNTYGYNPKDGGRFGEDVRWTGILRKKLGAKYSIMEEGCNGRSTFFDGDEPYPEMSTKNWLWRCLDGVDLVIISLGTNDFSAKIGATVEESAAAMEKAMGLIRSRSPEVQIILMSPMEILDGVDQVEGFGFNGDAVEKSKKLPKLHRELTERIGVYYLDAGAYAKPTSLDCIHLDEDGHGAIGNRLAEFVRRLKR